MGKGLEVEVKLDNLDAALLGLSRAQPQLKKATAPILGQIAKTLRSRARANVVTGHPSNYFKAGGSRLSPSYRTKQNSPYYWVVQTPSSNAGARESQAEFAHTGHTAQGRALVRGLTSVYGRSGGSGSGRILYKTRDELDAELASKLEAGVAQAAAAIEKEVNGG